MEDIDYRHPRGLDKSMTLGLSDCHWINQQLNLLLTGPTEWGSYYTPRYVIEDPMIFVGCPCATAPF